MFSVKSYLCSCDSCTVSNIKFGRKTAIQAESSLLVGMCEKLIQTEQLSVPMHKQTIHKQQAQRMWNCSLFLLFQTVLSRAPSRKVQQKYIWQKRTWKTWWWRDHKLLGSGYGVQLCRCLGFKPAEMLPPSSNQMKQSEEVGRGYSNKFPTDLHGGSAAYRITKKVSAKQENNSQTLLIHTQPFISLKIQKHSKSLCSQKGPEAQLKVGQVAWGKPQLLTQEQLCQSITAGSVPKAVGQALKIENGWRYRQKITWDTKQGSKWRPSRDPTIPKRMLCTEPALQLKPCA